MESDSSTIYLALSDCHPEYCDSKVLRRASVGDIEALAGELPMLPERSHRRAYLSIANNKRILSGCEVFGQN